MIKLVKQLIRVKQLEEENAIKYKKYPRTSIYTY